MKILKNKNGITLIALIITIILLLILAGVSFSFIIQGGILDKSQQAVNEYKKSSENENNVLNYIDDYLKDETENKKIYNDPKAEDNIAPQDLFTYEIIDDGSIASTIDMTTLPEKNARITGIKPQYIYGYNTENNKIIDSNYQIQYSGLTDTLVIPYKLKIGNDFYKVTEVDLSIPGYASEKNGLAGPGVVKFPGIKKIIYPNTVEKILYPTKSWYDERYNSYITSLEEIILSDNLKTINDEEFCEISSLRKVYIPNSITSIGVNSFLGCINLEEVTMSDNIIEIGGQAFWGCRELTEIKIPKNVTNIQFLTFAYCDNLSKIDIEGDIDNIEQLAFAECNNLKELVIPGNVTYIDEEAFSGWNSTQTIYFECSEENSKNWNPDWKAECTANIFWNYKSNENAE